MNKISCVLCTLLIQLHRAVLPRGLIGRAENALGYTLFMLKCLRSFEIRRLLYSQR